MREKILDPDMQAMDVLAQKQKEQELTVQEIEAMYGDGLPYERLRIEEEIRFFQIQASESLVQMGKRLILLKAKEERGGFLKSLENVNMSPRSAQMAMSAAHKFSNAKSISHLGATKLIALSVLDDDEIKEVDDLGVYANKTIDEIEKMSVKQLKETIRAEREKRQAEKEEAEKRSQALEKVLAEKNNKLNEMEGQLLYRQPPTKEQLAQAELDRMGIDLVTALVEANNSMQKVMSYVERASNIVGVNGDQLDAWVKNYQPSISAIDDSFQEMNASLENICPAIAE